MQNWPTQPFDAAFLRSAQRFFIISDSRFLPAGVILPPRFLGEGAALATPEFFALLSAQRRFIAKAIRWRASGDIPPLRFGAAFGGWPLRAIPAPSSNAVIARPI